METKFFEKDGRKFTWRCVEPYVRKDGTLTELDVWHGTCAHPGCGEQFIVRTAINCELGLSQSFARKHCDTHKLTMPEVRSRWKAAARVGQRLTPAQAEDIISMRDQGADDLTIELLSSYPLGTIRRVLRNAE